MKILKDGGEVGLKTFISALDYVSEITPMCCYIMNCTTHQIVYYTPNVSLLFGRASINLRRFDYRSFEGHIMQSEREEIATAFNRLQGNQRSLGISDLRDCIIACDVHLHTKIDGTDRADGKSILLHQKMSPITLNSDGSVKHMLFTLSFSSKKYAGPIHVWTKDRSEYYQYDSTKKEWKKAAFIKLSVTDKEILRLSAQGYTTSDIANELCKSVDSIKQHKAALYKILDSTNIAGAISKAIKLGFL